MHYTTSCNKQSSAPEDGRDQHPKHVDLIGIINKLLLLHLVGVDIIYTHDARSNKYQIFSELSTITFVANLFHQCVVQNRYTELIEPHFLSDKQRGKKGLSEHGVCREFSGN